MPVRPSARRTQDVAGALLLAAMAGAACSRLYAVDPNKPGHYPVCPFRLLTGGLNCPGCGSLRATHDLLHGQVFAALDRNALLVVVAPVLIAAWFVTVGRGLGLRVRLPAVPPWAMKAIPVVVVVFWIARNLPGPTHWLAA